MQLTTLSRSEGEKPMIEQHNNELNNNMNELNINLNKLNKNLNEFNINYLYNFCNGILFAN